MACWFVFFINSADSLRINNGCTLERPLGKPNWLLLREFQPKFDFKIIFSNICARQLDIEISLRFIDQIQHSYDPLE